MRNSNAQLEQIQLLIDRIQNHFTHDLMQSKYNYDKLLMLSEQFNYSYGKALAHIYLAQYFFMVKDNKEYRFHRKWAWNIAEENDYFDVLIECYKQEGLRNICNCDEMAAISMYLDGIHIADEIKDKKSCAVFYNAIAEMLRWSGAHKEAEKFYLKALSEIQGLPVKNAKFYHKTILINLLHLAAICGEIQRAKDYLAECNKISCESGVLPLLLMEGEIHILLLEKNTAATEKVDELITKLTKSKQDTTILKQVYIVLMDLLFLLNNKDYAEWCLKQIDTLYENENLHQNFSVWLKKTHIHYAKVFGVKDKNLYKDFYETTLKGELLNRQATAESFKNFIALYENEKANHHLTAEWEHLQMVANTDSLTNSYNRRYFNKLFSKFLQDEHLTSLGYVMVDVDYFKEYNDYYGHAQGDIALIEVASLLMDHLPEGAYAARYGGDEFSCLFVNKSEDEIISFVKTIQKSLHDKNIPHIKSKSADKLTLSFGIYHETQLQDCVEKEIIERADHALYEAKKEGRNTYAVYI